LLFLKTKSACNFDTCVVVMRALVPLLLGSMDLAQRFLIFMLPRR